MRAFKERRVVGNMSGSTCIVTGGAGFIGCAISHYLVPLFERCIVIDSLHPQIHSTQIRPHGLHAGAELVVGDVTNVEIWNEVLSNAQPDCVIHLAAETGTGQSLHEATRHAMVNVVGTTAMIDAFNRKSRIPQHILLASSRATYGEGAWARDGNIFYPGQRSLSQLKSHEWDFTGAEHIPVKAGVTLTQPTSIYGATKLAQETTLAAWATAFDVSLSILRFQNVYGPGQSLINSYTGIVSLFARLAREGRSIPLYEDGKMIRDFVFIDDVAAAINAAVVQPLPGSRRLDVGSGTPSTLQKVAELISARYNAPEPHVNAMFRLGDVRHASCDLSPTLAALDWTPRWALRDGLDALCAWIDNELR